jgi:hypothetical protein
MHAMSGRGDTQADGNMEEQTPGTFADFEAVDTTQSQMANVPDRKELAMELYSSGDYKTIQDAIEDADAYLSLFGASPGGEDPKANMTAEERKFYNIADLGEKALGMLESGNVESGKLASLESKFGEFFGTQDQNVTDYKATLDNASYMLRNMLAGASLMPAEEQKMLSFIPKYSDPPEVAIPKLRSFISNMRMMSGADTNQGLPEQYIDPRQVNTQQKGLLAM